MKQLLSLVVVLFGWNSTTAVTLEQIISREHPHYDNARAVLDVGRDGLVYLGNSASGDTAHVIRMSRDGKDRFGGTVVYALSNATANKAGTVATANAHFAHKVVLYDERLEQLGAVSDFLVSDAVGWDAPAHVEAGASGDFYGVDQHRNRILRISPQGKLLRAYAIPRELEGHAGLIVDFRVSEKDKAFYVVARQGPLRAVGFDGKTKWTLEVAGLNQYHHGFDVAEDGALYAIGPYDDVVKKISPDGLITGEVKLQMGELQPRHGTPGMNYLQVFGDEVLVKRPHTTEMFQRYSLASGERLSIAAIDHERLAVSYSSEVWTAGETVPLSIEFSSSDARLSPAWRVWLRAVDHLDYQELPVREGKVHVPKGLGGAYLLKVTPEAQPGQRGAAADYIVRGWIEVRQPDAAGSVAVLTPKRRVYYGQGEAIPITVMRRGKDAGPVEVEVRIIARMKGEGGRMKVKVEGGNERVHPSSFILHPSLPIAADKPSELTIPASITRALVPGEYRIVASGPKLTSIAQAIVIGPGSHVSKFLRMRHGDYGQTYPAASLWDAPDVVAAHVQRERRLGFNTFVDRIGTHIQIGALGWDNQNQAQWKELVKRLQDDPAAAPPETVQTASPLLQTMAAYSAYDMKQMAILLYMDAGLPLGGPGFDNRTPEQMAKDLQTVTTALLPYPAFRGWSWHANWWIYEQRGSAAATSPEEKAAYEAALAQAKETGAWSDVLDRVSERRLNYAVQAQDFFAGALHEVAPEERLKTASAGTYRNVESYPPISFQNVEEVDLQGQFEQIFIPYFPVHAVDFYRRPGKPVWGHPEVWNDDGTGGQVLPELFSMLMRSPNGLGISGTVPPWTGKAGIVEDPRLAHFGAVSIFRALNGIFERYGGWISTLEPNDHVAIVASPRQFKIDEWGHVTGRHFARLLEAYVSCLHAHHPASIVFVDDLQPETLAKYKAVLIVDQWVEMEPMLKTALERARAAGATVLYDGTCRAELVKGFTPLGVAFDKFEQDRHPASDDAAYYRFPQYVRENLPAVKKMLDAASPPAARVENPEVWISELKSGAGRYLFVVNNTSVPLEPSRMWRTTLHVASLLPVVEQVRFTAPAPAVYDVFAMKRVEPQDDAVTADLRDLPARLYALLPAAIGSVVLRGPSQLSAGQPLQWSVEVRDEAGRAIDASIPLRVRLLAGDGSVLAEESLAAAGGSAAGEFVAPLNAPNGLQTLEVAELLSGESARLELKVAPIAHSVSLATLKLDDKSAEANATGKAAETALVPSENDFGPHVRDMILLDGGKIAVVNAMNWNHNLYGVDAATGNILWRNKVGSYFAFAPQSLGGEFAVQGFDYDTAEGYHLYLLGSDGQPQRRFALYGLPRRLPHRFVPGLINDREAPINNFATPADGSWVAAAGDLGLAVWDQSGKLLWKQDWWKEERHVARLAALGDSTLLTAEGMTVTAYDARSGRRLWEHQLAVTGRVRKIVVSSDGTTAAVLATTEGGRMFVIRDGQIVRRLTASGEDIALSADGSRIVVVGENQLSYLSLEGGLKWIHSGDDRLRNPRLSADGSRVAVSSELGTLYVLDAGGETPYHHNNNALSVPAWLPDGDLLVANWMGNVTRLDGDFDAKWSVRIEPAAIGPARQAGPAPGTALTDPHAPTIQPPSGPVRQTGPTLPTARITGWGNTAEEPLPLTPNLLSETKAIVRFVAEGSPHIQLVRKPDELTDGHPQSPDEPWLDWGDINWFAEMNPSTYLELDTFRTQVRVDAVTFVEDPARPDSWLRDAALEYWDAESERWVHVQPFLSDRAVHTHKLAKAVEAARFRIVLPRGFFGNLRLAEIVLHGEALGASHPDVLAKRPVAVLFDDSEEFKNIYPYHDRWSFQLDGAYSGGRFWQVNANQHIAPTFYPTFGHTVPNWDIEIAEKPEAGQYRYVQWAWKALSPDVKGATLQLVGEGPSVRLHAGQVSGPDHVPTHEVGQAVPGEWQTVRIDLWEVLKKPTRLRSMYLGAAGGPVGFDQVILGRSEADLEKVERE